MDMAARAAASIAGFLCHCFIGLPAPFLKSVAAVSHGEASIKAMLLHSGEPEKKVFHIFRSYSGKEILSSMKRQGIKSPKIEKVFKR